MSRKSCWPWSTTFECLTLTTFLLMVPLQVNVSNKESAVTSLCNALNFCGEVVAVGTQLTFLLELHVTERAV